MPAGLDPAVISERAAAAARGLLLGGVTPEAIAQAVAELEALGPHPDPASLAAWGACPRPLRLQRLVAACAAAGKRPDTLRLQLQFLRRIRMLAAFTVALTMASGLDRERARRQTRARFLREQEP